MLSGATRGAARTIRDKMTRIAAHAMEMSPDDVECVDGTFRAKGAPGTSMTMGEVAMRAHLFMHDNPAGESSGLVDTHTYDHPYSTPPSADRTDMGAFYPMVSHACHIPIVEVDPETGRVTLLKYYAVNDCGTIMNPPLVEGQIMGGIVQGIGAALMEQYDYREDGTLGTPSLREYLIPSLHEVPDIVVEHIQTPSPFTEYGVKGAGEGGRLVAPTAIASAVSDALRPLGVFIDELPMTPERIVTAVQAARDDHRRRHEGWGPRALCRTRAPRAAAWCGRAASTRWRPSGSTACRCSPATRRSRWCPTARRTASRWGRRTSGRPRNDVRLGCMTELLTATSHSGAHIDALAHMTVGEDAHWYGGANAGDHLGDFGPTVGDAAQLPPLFTRGVLLDVAGHRGVERLPAGSRVDADEVAAIARPKTSRSASTTSCCSAPATWACGRTRRGWPSTARPGPTSRRRALAGPRGRGGRQRHRDVRGAARARPGNARQPAAGPHPAADRERRLHPGEPRPRAARRRPRVRVPVRRPPAQDRGCDGLDAGPAGGRVSG